MENLLIGLILAAVSGVTLVAYKHPVLYEREFGPKILYSALFIFGFAVVYEIGFGAAIERLTPYLINSESPEIQSLLEASGMNEYVYLISISAAIYSGFLSWLADHLNNECDGES